MTETTLQDPEIERLIHKLIIDLYSYQESHPHTWREEREREIVLGFLADVRLHTNPRDK